MAKIPKKEILAWEDDPLWFKDALIYEIHVKAFSDSDGDGIGDFQGLTSKLDYLQDLGVNTLWLLPFYPSPLKDDGYDISNYTEIHPAYGKMKDFQIFLREAHRRGLRIITELVLNHTSDQHSWFQRARRAKPNSSWRNFYVWSDDPFRYPEARIIFQDFESSNWAWDPWAKTYYWHRFYAHQPDLNYDNPQVRKAIMHVLDFWLHQGVDGLRLDAVPYLYEREGTNCENLPQTFQFLRDLRAHVDQRFPNRMLLAEANQWPEDAVAYFGQGDICHMAFHFPLMPRLFMALHMEDRFPILDILEQTPSIPANCQWALFLRNHDELTLEMVTDEERDYMYRVYAQTPQMRLNLGIRRRLAPLLGNHRRRMELMNGLLFSLPGTPIIYYGDELGMGDNVYLGDRNGVRTPMQWSADRNAGFSKANPQCLYLPIIIDPEYHYEMINVEVQQNNPYSFLWWMKRLIALRKRLKVLSRGSIEFLSPENQKVLVFLRRLGQETILVVANLSRFVQYLELDLSAFKGMVPVELFGRIDFPRIGDLPYFFTLGPHSFYWFALESRTEIAPEIKPLGHPERLPGLSVTGRWERILTGRNKIFLERVLSNYVRSARWFGGKARTIRGVVIQEILPIMDMEFPAFLTLLRVEYIQGDGEAYTLPLMYASGEEALKIRQDHPQAVIAQVQFLDREEKGIIFDGTIRESFSEALLVGMARHRQRKGLKGELIATRTHRLDQLRKPGEGARQYILLRGEQSNTSVICGERFILKLFRRIQPGINPELEISRFLTGKEFTYTPSLAGAIEYYQKRGEPITLAVLHEFIPNKGDAWKFTLDVLANFFEQIPAQKEKVMASPSPPLSTSDSLPQEVPSLAAEIIGPYLELVRLLGKRTGELHLTLASDYTMPAFSPEPFSKLYQRSLYQSMRNLTRKVLQILKNRLKDLPAETILGAQKIIEAESKILQRFQVIINLKVTAMRIRCHGDYHLGQVLFTGKDFVIIDFEGEPARPLSERRLKRSPLRDVAGMLRSFHYAAQAALKNQQGKGLIRTEDLPFMEKAANYWSSWVCAAFLQTYMQVVSQGSFLPRDQKEFQILLDLFLLEKAIYELGYELNNRPDWVIIPLKGISHLLEDQDLSTKEESARR